MESPVEPPAGRSGVANEQQPRVRRRHHAFNALVDGIRNALGLVHHHQNILAVETLKLIGARSGKTQGVAVIAQLPARVQQDAAESLRRPAVQSVNLPPENVANLAESRRRADDNGRAAGVHKPQDRHRGSEILAQPVAGLDGHPRAPGQRAQRLLLLLPQSYAQNFSGKPHRVVAETGQRLPPVSFRAALLRATDAAVMIGG